ncbi:MAG: A/G-specific adenine glycosylase [Betaproteobacteria bacterium]
MLAFAERLIAWQRAHGRHHLPWQNTRDAYCIWLSEIMLQQTQVATVIPYYQRFVAAFADVRALAAAPLEDVLALWSGLGYYRRAHLLHRAARVVVADHHGVFPHDAATLATLPGIGRSTAAAIAAFAADERGAILDGNVKRVLARHAGIAGFPGEAGVERDLWECAEARLPERDIAIYTQALMDHGATVCLRLRPRCDVCPVATDCVARIESRIDVLPAPRRKKALPQRTVAVLLILHHDCVLVERRPATGIWAGLWSLPEAAFDDDPVQACHARFGAEVAMRAALPDIEHAFTHFRLRITPRPCVVARRVPRVEQPGLLWLPLSDATGAALPAPIKALLRRVGAEGRAGVAGRTSS